MRDTSIIGNVHPNISNRELVLYIVLGTGIIAGLESKTQRQRRGKREIEGYIDWTLCESRTEQFVGGRRHALFTNSTSTGENELI